MIFENLLYLVPTKGKILFFLSSLLIITYDIHDILKYQSKLTHIYHILHPSLLNGYHYFFSLLTLHVPLMSHESNMDPSDKSNV